MAFAVSPDRDDQRMLLIAALACVSEAPAQTLKLDYQQVVTRSVPGATAAFSLDPSRVGASVQDGLVTLVGRGPGSTNVIVISGDETVLASGPHR